SCGSRAGTRAPGSSSTCRGAPTSPSTRRARACWRDEMSSREERADTATVGAEEASGGRAPLQAAAWIVASTLILLISPWIPIPGIDREVAPAVFGGLDPGTAL